MMSIVDDNPAGTVLSLVSAPDPADLSVPVLATAADLREFVQYLRSKPNGVVAAEELDRPKKRLFDERKLVAYQLLGLTTTDGSSVRLSLKGRQFARNFESDARAFRCLLSQTRPWLSALQWLSEQNIEMITAPEIVCFWLTAQPAFLAQTDHEHMKGAVVSFFSFCQGAALGTMTLGKRGHITRFCTDHAELRRFLEEAPSLAVDEAKSAGVEDIEELASQASDETDFKVLINSYDQNLAGRLQQTLELAGLNSEQIKVGWSSRLSSHNLFWGYRRNECALLVLLGEDAFHLDSSGNYLLNERLLLRLGAAHILFDHRVVVIASKRVSSLSGFAELNYYEVDGEQMGWELILQVVKVLIEMKTRVQPTKESIHRLR